MLIVYNSFSYNLKRDIEKQIFLFEFPDIELHVDSWSHQKD